MTLLSDIPYLFIDLQATGASPRHGQLLELGWSRGERVAAYLVDPGHEVPRQVSRITGINQAMMVDALPPAAVLQLLRQQLEVATVVVAHVSRYEMAFLQPLWQKHFGEDWPCPVLCTHQLAQRLLPTLPSLSLRAVAGHFSFPAERARRASDHVQATVAVWRGLGQLLATHTDVRTLSDLQLWLQQPRPGNKRPRVYPMARDVRLKLPASAGIYRMLDGAGRVLYVGKALSLKARVNSYFRQRRGHAPAKLEMLAQVVAIDVQTVATGLEAALLESDEIKRLDPPYNTALRAVARPCIYLDHALMPAAGPPRALQHFGPFPHAESALFPALLGQTLANPEQAPALAKILREEDGCALTEAALGLFSQQYGLRVPNARILLALGIWLVRRERAEVEEAEEVEVDAHGHDIEKAEAPLTAAHLVQRMVAGLENAAQAFLRARKVQRLLNSDVTWREPGEERERHLRVRSGQIVAAYWAGGEASAEVAAQLSLQKGESADAVRRVITNAASTGVNLPEDRATYDRMRTLLTELNRVGLTRAVISLAELS